MTQQSLLSKSLVVYPNPTENTITISNIVSRGENTTLEVFSVNGNKVMQKLVPGGDKDIVLDVNNLSSGVYIYKIIGKSNKFIKK